MVTVCSGGTGTPKLLAGLERSRFEPGRTTVVGNTGDDIEFGGLLVCPDLDTVLYERGGVLDRETWWGRADETFETDAELDRLTGATDGLVEGPCYLPDDLQTAGRRIARWRRFAGTSGFLTIGDGDRALHVARTSLLDLGHPLTGVFRTLADAFDLDLDLVPMSDDPVATLVHTPGDDRPLHFQEFWVAERAEPAVERIELRGSASATPGAAVLDALDAPVIVGPSNPVTSIGPMLAIDGIRVALHETPVVAVSPFVGDTAFSGPVSELMAAAGHDPSTAGVLDAYPFADGFVIDPDDPVAPDRPTARVDVSIDGDGNAARILDACADLLAEVGADVPGDAPGAPRTPPDRADEGARP